jgi:hypothetical protein
VDDDMALGAAIERVLEDPGLAERLARAGRELVLREFDMERVVDRHVELFASLEPRTSRHGRLFSIYGRFFAMLILGWFYALGRRGYPRREVGAGP